MADGMMLITMVSGHCGLSLEGRIPAPLPGLHAFDVFGYITRALANYFDGREISDGRSKHRPAKSIEDLSIDLDVL